MSGELLRQPQPTHTCTFPDGNGIIPSIPNHALAKMSDEGAIWRCECGRKWIAERAGGGCWWTRLKWWQG